MIGRSCIDGYVPLFAITANIRGAGKSLLAKGTLKKMKLFRKRCSKSAASTSTGDNSGVVFVDSSVAFMVAS
jgi:hypothetical protein